MESTSLTTSFEHLGPFDMQQNNGLKFSHGRKNYIDFQLDVLGGVGWGYFENVQWTLCVRESICVRPQSLACFESLQTFIIKCVKSYCLFLSTE